MQPMKTPEKVSSISALHRFLGLRKPSNPLISVFNFDDVQLEPETILSTVITDFYVVALKKTAQVENANMGSSIMILRKGLCTLLHLIRFCSLKIFF